MGQPDVPRLLASMSLPALAAWMAFDAVEPINVAGRIAAGFGRRGIDGDDAEALHAAAAAWAGGR